MLRSDGPTTNRHNPGRWRVRLASHGISGKLEVVAEDKSSSPDVDRAVLLLSHATDRVRHGQGSFRWWRTGEVRKAFRRHREEAGQHHPDPDSSKDSSLQDAEQETLERWWVDWPTRMRVETENPHRPRLLIIDDDEWWSIDADGQVRGSAGYAMAFVYRGTAPEMLDPSALIHGTTITAAVETEWAGVKVLAADARPRCTMRQLAHVPTLALALHAERYRLLIHAELGVLVRAESYIDNQLAQVTELVDFTFGHPVDEDMFRFVMPKGATLEPAPDATGRLRDGTRAPNPWLPAKAQTTAKDSAPSTP